MDFEQAWDYIMNKKFSSSIRLKLWETCANNNVNEGIEILTKLIGCNATIARQVWEKYQCEHNTPETNPFILTEEQIKNRRLEELREAQKNIVKCPYCTSADVKKISTANRAFSISLFGLASKKIGKQWHCNGCKSEF